LDGGNIQNATTWKLRKWEQKINTVLREMDCREADEQKWFSQMYSKYAHGFFFCDWHHS
jgi:hypothetical protein